MGKNYVYRMDHDNGFAPNTSFGICSLTGCKNSKNRKKKNIEESAEPGSWVIGIGGKGTKKPDKLIYAMEVESTLPLELFQEKYPDKSKYLKGHTSGTNVLISRRFYYFGDNAIDVPGELKHIIINSQGCKKVFEEDIKKLKNHLSKEYKYGVYGNPNNPEAKEKCEKC
ncbi:MAG: hypothetical protein O8C61_00650 [Candidatus Methanoperedens sp.]|nr:hypothetical protein [Candidatus Methanoperedens sp.]